jgi:hypothetical protein
MSCIDPSIDGAEQTPPARASAGMPASRATAKIAATQPAEHR